MYSTVVSDHWGFENFRHSILGVLRAYKDPYRQQSDGLADAWAAADGRLPERPDTAESQFYENRAKAMGGAAQASARPSDC